MTFGQSHRHFGHWMCLNGLYLGTKYEVCRWNSLQDMKSSLFLPIFLETLTLTFCLLTLVKVIGTWVIKCASFGCILVPSMKSVDQIVIVIWTKVHQISCLTLKFEIWPWVKVTEENINKIPLSCFTINQIWIGLFKRFRNYLELKVFQVKVLSAWHRMLDAAWLYVKWSESDLDLRSVKLKCSRLKIAIPNPDDRPHRQGSNHIRVTKFDCDSKIKLDKWN